MRRCLEAALAALVLSGSAHAFDEPAALKASQAAIGRQPGDYRFVDSNGAPRRLAELRGKPLVVSFVYTGCFQACPAATQFLARAVREAERSLGPGSFRVATIGFNLPFDSPEAMKAFALKAGVASPNWLFLSPKADTLETLVREFGFRYEATAAGFDHLLQASILDAEGRIYRQVYGEQLEAPLFVGPLLELARNAPVERSTAGALLEKAKILCTVYDPAAGRYRVNYAVVIELLVGASVLLVGTLFVVLEWIRRRRSAQRALRGA